MGASSHQQASGRALLPRVPRLPQGVHFLHTILFIVFIIVSSFVSTIQHHHHHHHKRLLICILNIVAKIIIHHHSSSFIINMHIHHLSLSIFIDHPSEHPSSSVTLVVTVICITRKGLTNAIRRLFVEKLLSSDGVLALTRPVDRTSGRQAEGKLVALIFELVTLSPMFIARSSHRGIDAIGTTQATANGESNPEILHQQEYTGVNRANRMWNLVVRRSADMRA